MEALKEEMIKLATESYKEGVDAGVNVAITSIKKVLKECVDNGTDAFTLDQIIWVMDIFLEERDKFAEGED